MAEPLEAEITVNIKKLASSLAAAEARFKKTADRFENDSRRANARVSTALAGSAAGFARLGQVSGAQRFVLQNTANQIGDIAVQLASGTSAARTFGQQLPQILGGFGALGGTLGLVGPLLGTIAALGIPLAAMLLTTGDKAEETADKVRTFQQSLSDATSALGRAEDALRLAAAGAASDVAKRYSVLNGEIQKLIGSLVELEVFGAKQQGNELIGAILPSLTASREQLRLATEEYTNQILRLNEIQALQQGVATMDQSRFDALEKERLAIEAQLQTTRSLREELRNIGDTLNLLPDEAAKFAGYIVDAQDAMKRGEFEAAADALRAAQEYARTLGFTIEDEIVRNLIQAEDFTRQTAARMGDVQIAADGVVASTGGIVANISSAANQAARLARNLADSAKDINFPGSDLAPSTSPRPRLPPPLIGEDAGAAPSGGGKGGGVNPLIAQLESIRKSLLSQEQLEIESFARQQEQLQAALAQKLLTQQEFNTLTEEAQRQHADRMSKIDVYRYGTGLQKTEQFFGDMATAFASGNDEMLKISKAFGAAQALISAWQGAAEALKLPFPANLAAFAQVLATGLGAVSAIKSIGKGGTGGSPSAAAPVAAAPTQAGTYVNVTLTGGLFGADQVRGLIKQINSVLEDGGRVAGIGVR